MLQSGPLLEKLKSYKKLLSKALFYFLVFTAVSILLSMWLGKFFLNTPFLFVASLLITICLAIKFPVKIEFRIPKTALFFASIAAFLCAYPFLFVTPFYMGSSDALHTTTLRVLKIAERIPETYEPFSRISFTYSFAYHLFVKLFSDIFYFLPEHAILWFFGVLFSFIQVILFYLFAEQFLNSKNAAFIGSAIFIGTKVLYQDMYFGLFPRILFSCVFFLFFILLSKKNSYAFLFLPLLIILHPGLLFVASIFLLLYFFIFNRFDFLNPKLLLSTLLAMPAILITYVPYFVNFISGFTSNVITAVPQNISTLLLAVLLWMGWIPLILFVASIFLVAKKRKFAKIEIFCLLIVILQFALFLLFSIKNMKGANVLIWSYSLCSVLFSSSVLSRQKIVVKLMPYALALIVTFSLISFFSSSYLAAKVAGSKISPEEAKFAFLFKEFDPSLKRVLFLTPGGGKIAELSNKIPFDGTRGFFLPRSSAILWHDDAYYEMLEKKKKFDEIVETQCVECIYDLNVDYVVINKSYFPKTLPEELVLKYGNIKLYEIKNRNESVVENEGPS